VGKLLNFGSFIGGKLTPQPQKIKQPFRVIVINCMKFDTTDTIFTEILHQIDGSRKTAKRAITILEELFKEDTHMT